jgi:hypothetical protein
MQREVSTYAYNSQKRKKNKNYYYSPVNFFQDDTEYWSIGVRE